MDYCFKESGARSNCCDAPIIMSDICSDCGEHCEDINEEE